MSVATVPVRRLAARDLARLASVGLRTRRMRAALSALGIAIGVGAIVAVLGLSSSSQAGLLNEINRLGTNLLTVTPGQSFTDQAAKLPVAAPAMIARISGVTNVQYTGQTTANAYRSPLIPSIDTNELTVEASSLGLPKAAGTSLRTGTYLNAATQNEPVCVLGAAAAQFLGINAVLPGERIWINNMWFYVAGILKPAPLAPEIDTSVLVGFPEAERYLGLADQYLGVDGNPTEIYVRSDTAKVNVVDSLLADTTNPVNPSEVDVSQPSAALVAEADAKGALNSLFLGLGAVSLLVGAVGVGNVMLIGVLERRSEIGLRRALGATRGHIRLQFLSESVLLSLLGGAVGITAGAIATAIYASTQHWSVVIPTEAWAGGFAAALLIGTIAGLLPALRAARMSPTEALWAV